jgi:hypothetical protein
MTGGGLVEPLQVSLLGSLGPSDPGQTGVLRPMVCKRDSSGTALTSRRASFEEVNDVKALASAGRVRSKEAFLCTSKESWRPQPLRDNPSVGRKCGGTTH